MRSRYTAHSSWGLFSNLIRSFPFSCGLSVESVSLTGVQYLASVWEDELKSQETWCNIFWGYLGPCKLSKKKQSRLGGGTLWYQVIYNRDSDQGDNEYINYWRNKKREREKISLWTLSNSPKGIWKDSSYMIFHKLHKNARKDRYVAKYIILSGSFLFQSPASWPLPL